jgi:hypothetical protein
MSKRAHNHQTQCRSRKGIPHRYCPTQVDVDSDTGKPIRCGLYLGMVMYDHCWEHTDHRLPDTTPPDAPRAIFRMPPYPRP